MWHGLSVICKVVTVVLSVITLQFGLRKVDDGDDDDTEVPFYDSSLYRYVCSVGLCVQCRSVCAV